MSALAATALKRVTAATVADAVVAPPVLSLKLRLRELAAGTLPVTARVLLLLSASM